MEAPELEITDVTGIGEVVEPHELPFDERVNRLLSMMNQDSGIRDRMLCEIYIGFTDMERGMRTMMQNGGPVAMLKAMMGRG